MNIRNSSDGNNSQECLNAFLKEQFVALILLYKSNLLTPFLMVFFSTIEILGTITGLTFDGFVKKYMTINLPKNIHAVDLWGARCSILHSNSPESEHSKKKKAKEILYAWGKADINLAKKVIEKAEKANDYTYIKVEDLRSSLEKAVVLLQQDFNRYPTFWKNSAKKIDKFYSRIDLNDGA